ncbi:MAG: hypothetical protein ABR570_05815 [Burkholderiales bacterium]
MPKSRGTPSSKKRATSKRTAETPAKENAPLAGHVIERPDGFYWESAAKKRETRGPFTTLAEAQADMLSDGGEGGDDEEAEVPQDLHEAESELGISEWIDPDTGGPAEDHIPRIEDH